jgi:UDP:flavonoid glycosyltransferase YjiC (YdhE family)
VRVLLSTCASRGDVEPLLGLAVRLRALGAEVRVCAPPDEEFAELLAGVGAGTTTTAARAGAPHVVVPRVVVPPVVDQPYWAGRVADLGIGTARDGPTRTTESLSAALRTALTPRPARERPPWPARSAPTGDGGRDLLLDTVGREEPPVTA